MPAFKKLQLQNVAINASSHRLAARPAALARRALSTVRQYIVQAKRPADSTTSVQHVCKHNHPQRNLHTASTWASAAAALRRTPKPPQVETTLPERSLDIPSSRIDDRKVVIGFDTEEWTRLYVFSPLSEDPSLTL